MKLDRRLRLALTALLIIVIAGGAVYLNRNQQIFERVTSESGEVVYTVDPAKSNIFLTAGNDLTVANSSGITAVSRSGSVRYSLEANTNNPLVRTAGDYILLADQEGNDAYFIHNGRIKKHFVAEHSIVSGAVNETGSFILVTGEDGYRSRVSVYNDKGEEQYTWKVGDYYIIDVCLSDNGNSLAAAILSADNNKVSGGVAFVNINKQSITNLVKLDNTILSYVQYDGRNVIAVGNDRALCFSKDGKQKWEVDYNGKKLQTFAAEQNGDIALSFETGMNNSMLEMYSSRGRLKGSCELDYDVINLDISSNKVLAVGSKTLTEMTHKGIVRTTVNMENEVKYGALCGSGKVFFAAGTDIKIMNP